MQRIGVDWGGTKIELAIVAGDGAIAWRRREPTPRGDYRACIEVVRRLVAAAEDRLGETASVGIGIPGSLSPASGLVKNANSTWLNGKPLQADIESALERPVRVANDADCLAHSEAVGGAGHGKHCVFGVIIGTGVGGGIALGGNAYHGASNSAGEWGHLPLPEAAAAGLPARQCWCGRLNCIETYLCGPAFELEYRELTGESRDARDISELALGGNAAATEVLERYAERLARSLALIVNLLDPDVIVLGGGMSNTPGLYERLPRLCAPHVFTDVFETPIVQAKYGDSSGVRGAAWLWRGPAR